MSKMTKEFNSQICTTKEQSERLLALGIKKETADMMLIRNFGYLLEEPYRVTIWDPQTLSLHDNFQEFIDSMTRNLKGIDEQYVNDSYKPAWSLDRLIKLIPENIITGVSNQWHRVMYNSVLTYEEGDDSLVSFRGGTIYDRCISCIYWLIKEGHFPKEYLV